jgi:pyruvate dehydrogenase E1 component beta subunit
MSTLTELLKFTEAIYEATASILANEPKSFVIGLGVSYKNGADGTMGELKQTYPDRILDTPVSEAAVTGLALGAATNGLRPIVHHGRVEFALFAADQIFTQASKWNYMFGGNYSAAIVIRVAIGRQWGNGPQHTQALYSLFASVPGLKVVVPSSPFMAKGLLESAARDNNPVIFLEPRWLYQLKQQVPVHSYTVELGAARTIKTGSDITIVSYGDGVIESVRAATKLEEHGIYAEVIDLVSLNPIDYDQIVESVSRTRHLVVFETTNRTAGVGSFVSAEVSSRITTNVKVQLIAAPHVPVPTSTVLTEQYYPTWLDILKAVLPTSDWKSLDSSLSFEEWHLPPGEEVNW